MISFMSDNRLIRYTPDHKTWIVVAYAPDMVTAEIPAGLLRSAGIPVFLFREAAGSSAIPVTFGLLGGVEVGVPEAYYQEALTLIEGDDESPDQPADQLEPGDSPPNEDP
jgi:hypothetical protein